MAESTSSAGNVSDEEFQVEEDSTPGIVTTLNRLKKFSYYLVENVELNLNFCLGILEERDVPSKTNSIYTMALSKLLTAVPKVGSGLSTALSKGEIVIFDKLDKNNSKTLADLVYHFSDNKSQVREILIQSCVDIFYSFEKQFMKLTCNGGPDRAMQKLAIDAADRIFNYFLQTEQKRDVTRTEITKGVLFGDSKRNKVGVKEGKTVLNDEVNWKTCSLYSKTGIIIDDLLFRSDNSKTEKYGHRRLFPWENVDEIMQTWVLESGSSVGCYALTGREDFLKEVRDYIMTKNRFEAAKLQRENYSREAESDRQAKHEELLRAFQEHFKELLDDIQMQYQVIVDNHRENKHLVRDISKKQEDEKVFHREITTKLEEIKRDLNDTKVLIETKEVTRQETSVVQQQPASTAGTLTVEQVQSIIRRESKVNVKQQMVGVVREKLAQNDPGPRIHKEVKRNLRKLGLKW